jgi:hypothetical protein
VKKKVKKKNRPKVLDHHGLTKKEKRKKRKKEFTMLVLYMTRVTTAAGSYVTHGFPFEIRRIIKSTSTTEYAEYIDSAESVGHKFAVTRMRSWVVSANVPHECDVARCAGGARARRAWPRVSTALAAYTFLVSRLNADLARLVIVESLGPSGPSVPTYGGANGAVGAIGQTDESSETSALGGTSAIDAMIT